MKGTAGIGASSAALTGQLLSLQELQFTGLQEPQSISSQKAHYTVMFILKEQIFELLLFGVGGKCIYFSKAMRCGYINHHGKLMALVRQLNRKKYSFILNINALMWHTFKKHLRNEDDTKN